VGDVLAAFVVVFLAELGDKTQLVALTVGSRYPPARVVLALTGAIAVLQTISVTVGAIVSRALPDRAVAIGTGILFLGFAVWTWRSSDEPDDDPAAARSGLLSVAGAFFVAELGDKTMLATVTLAVDNGWFGTWLGSTLGMVLADALAIGLGLWLGKNLPEKAVKYGAAAAFTLFGALLIWQGLRG
jgi:putative Ca2+/H+ antiporter (TMEM165/GDT1 family)